MNRLSRRQFITVAGALGATMGWADAKTAPSSLAWKERRDLFAEGVASGDPATDSVLLWTRYSAGGTAQGVSPAQIQHWDCTPWQVITSTLAQTDQATATYDFYKGIAALAPHESYAVRSMGVGTFRWANLERCTTQ